MAIVPIQFVAASSFCLFLWTKKIGPALVVARYLACFVGSFLQTTTFTSTNLHVKRIMLQQKGYSGRGKVVDM